MFILLQDGEIIDLKAVVSISNLVNTDTRAYYIVTFSGGFRLTIKEDYKSRAAFLVEWATAKGYEKLIT